MKMIDATSAEAQSADLTAANIMQIKALFPELITEGANGVAVNVDVLKALVGDKTATDAEEKYGLNWHGKRQARKLALTPSAGTLRPCPEDSVDWDTTQNVMVEGDNLEVLKLLQKSYAGKVKLIYIDPPYNTGKDFVYPDNFQDSIKNYLELTGQAEGGRRISSNTDASGRFHTDWLNMIYPRLRLARELLSQEGAIFISIDDNEAPALRKVADEIFGEENFVACCVWQKRYSRENRGAIGDAHEYLIVYARDFDYFQRVRGLIAPTEEQTAVYRNSNNDPKGRWRPVPMTAQGYRPNQMYEVVTPSGARHRPPEGRCWGMIEREYFKLVEQGRIYYGKDGSAQPNVIRYLTELEGLVPWTWWPASEVGHTDEARKEIQTIFGSQSVFDTPKPTRLLQRVLEIGTDPSSDDVVLDFFAGSGTMGEAVFRQNLKDGGRRRFIAVQLPEPIAEGDYATVADITKGRLRQAAKALKPSAPAGADLGFRVFSLDTSNIRAWVPNSSDLVQSLLDSQDHLLEDRSESDLLYELLLKFGLDLCVPISHQAIAGKDVYAVGNGILMACLTPGIGAAEVEALAQGIVSWHKELAPSGDTTCVFCDSSFADDVAKTNMAAILVQNGIQNVRSL
ncbi:site-specific DNA-methyltransferase [Janthinobacterium sp. PLB04]|uniref:site-specific DNA-methyltransferase (adenine-specific) n=1 Tax=Janthinobacterium lividum TaxID=29581 RepID=A0AAJ4MVQ0_9BURK|nr:MULTISPECIES: site-specific DNA-methyltransferase [Janthinobacterium]KAB0331438.1 site-specific DNA-methyltransferase [Janthinobacterium lividum]QSX97631.1 site-specific DNA-methyltransferase [Janthinobacterium lividum]UGQ37578.1 site-specific DNA-methyltransferase [Janthinobacterium sp. PLB04]